MKEEIISINDSYDVKVEFEINTHGYNNEVNVLITIDDHGEQKIAYFCTKDELRELKVFMDKLQKMFTKIEGEIR